MKIIVPEPTPSLNKVLNWHWAIRKAEKSKWYAMLWSGCVGKEDNGFYTEVRITRYGPKTLDYDNLCGGMKSVVVDNLKQLALIEDDSPDKVNVEYLQEKGRPYRTEVELL